MEKAETVIKDILLEVLAQSADQSVSGIDSNTCIRYMNRFMAEMAILGASLGYTNITSSSQDVTIEDAGMSGLIFNTALRLCNSYDIPISQSLAMSASDSKQIMLLASNKQRPTQMPSTMPLGSGNYDQMYGVTDHFYQPKSDIELEKGGYILLESDTND